MTDPVKQSGLKQPDAKSTAKEKQPSAASPDLTKPKLRGRYRHIFFHGHTYTLVELETPFGTLECLFD